VHGDPEQGWLPADGLPNEVQLTVYLVIGLPLSLGAVQDTPADAFGSPTAITSVGASGNPFVLIGVTALEGAEGGPYPIELIAVTVKV
jgi:hypothetical protein